MGRINPSVSHAKDVNGRAELDRLGTAQGLSPTAEQI